jgi:predicted dehydrogenase
MTRIAVVGAGLIGRRHLSLVAASPTCSLASVVDPAPGAERLAAEFGVPWFAAIDAILDGAARPDGVILATPSELHAEQALVLIAARLPTLVEKPIATTVEDAERIATAAESSDVPVLVGHHRRHGSILAASRRIVDEGVLGRLVVLQGSALFRKPDAYFDEAPWRRRPGGGPLLINMIHEVDSLRYLGGEIRTVQAVASSAARGFEVEDTVAITFVFENGVLGSFLLSDDAAAATSWEHTAGENPAYPRVPGTDCYVLAGDRGSLSIPTMRLAVYDGEPSWWRPMRREVLEVEAADPLERQVEHFAAVVRGETQPLVTARDGARNLRIVAAIAEAARTARAVDVTSAALP